jgi:DNA-binding transcriptional MerR regulator
MLDPVNRAESTHRRYTDDDIRWVELLTKMRKTGMPIRTIRRYAELARAGEGNEAARLELLESHRRAVLAQLDEVTQNLEAIDYKIAVYREKLGT